MANQQQRWSYAEITEGAEGAIRQIIDREQQSGGWENRAVAYGVYLGWSKLTAGHKTPADDERLHKLVRRA